MILTIAGADFSGANIGQNNSVTITLNKTGANGSKSSVTLKKGESVSSNTVIATGLSLQTGYENLVVTVTMAGTGDVSGWYSNGVVTIPSDTLITGNITIKATASKIATGGGEVVDPEEPGTGGGSGDAFNDASMWLRQTMSATGVISNSSITQSNIMPKVNFKGSASVEATGIDIMMAWITYNSDGSFKERGGWVTLTQGQKAEFTDDYPFSCVIATKAINTEYSLEEMVSWINVIGTPDGEGDIIYTDDESMWVQQNISTSGTITPSTDPTYNRSNIMYNGKFEKPIKVTALSENLQFAVVSYNADGAFKARGSWVSLKTGTQATATDELPFNVVIATSEETAYTLSEMLTKVKVSSSN